MEPFHRPYVHITGLAVNCNSTAGTWTANIEPYVNFIKTEPGCKPAVRPRAPFCCQHMELQGKMTWKKPAPYNNRFVAVHGYITGIVLKVGSGTTIEAFKITVDSIEFLWR